MRRIFLYASIAVMAGLVFTNLYNSVVDAVNWGSNLPQSIESARAYFHAANPGNFYRVFSPVNQVLAILVLILFWKSGRQIRLCLALALLMALAGDALTFGYFYPRNAVLFQASIQSELRQISEASHEWSSMNWFRTLLILLGLIFQFLALDKLITTHRERVMI